MTRRSATAFCLVLTILLTAWSFGAARGQARANGVMVICTGGAAVTVAVDANGQPVGPVHLCPHCALASLAALELPAPQILPPHRVGAKVCFATHAAPQTSVHLIRAEPRGPPAFLA